MASLITSRVMVVIDFILNIYWAEYIWQAFHVSSVFKQIGREMVMRYSVPIMEYEPGTMMYVVIITLGAVVRIPWHQDITAWWHAVHCTTNGPTELLTICLRWWRIVLNYEMKFKYAFVINMISSTKWTLVLSFVKIIRGCRQRYFSQIW